MGDNFIRASLSVQGALFLYYQIIEWINLFPWNDIRHGNGQASLDLIVTVIIGGLILATWRRLRWVMGLGVGFYALWAWLEIDSWWAPYFHGASVEWKRTYDRFFGNTVKFLPSDGVHLPPDACHVLLQVLILAALTTSALALFQLLSRPRRRIVSRGFGKIAS